MRQSSWMMFSTNVVVVNNNIRSSATIVPSNSTIYRASSRCSTAHHVSDLVHTHTVIGWSNAWHRVEALRF